MVSPVSVVSEKPLHGFFSRACTLCDQREISESENGFRGLQCRITDHTDHTDRWPVIVALLADPARESPRLTKLPNLWPTARAEPHRIDRQDFDKDLHWRMGELVMPAPIPGCQECARAPRFANCTEPVAAGLVEHFELVRHPQDGSGCAVFVPRPGERSDAGGSPAHFPIEGSGIADVLARLLALGAIDDSEADLVRERCDEHSAEEWLTLLGWCEAAVLGAGPGPLAEASSARDPDFLSTPGEIRGSTHFPTQQNSDERSPCN